MNFVNFSKSYFFEATRMGKIYTFVLNSEISAAAVTTNERYFIDWSRLPQKAYKVTFSFNSGAVAVTDASTFCANIFCDLGSTATIAPTELNSNQAYRSGFLGTLRVSGIQVTAGATATNYLYAGTTDNVPIWLDSRPCSNLVRVEIHQSLATQFTEFTPAPVRYTLVLNLEEQ